MNFCSRSISIRRDSNRAKVYRTLSVLPKANLSRNITSRRDFLKLAGTAACAGALPPGTSFGFSCDGCRSLRPTFQQSELRSPDYVLRIGASPVEIAPITSSRPLLTTASSQDLYCASKKVSKRRSKYTTTRKLPSSCTGTAKWFPRMWMALRKKDAIHPGARNAPDCVYSTAIWLPSLSHA